MSKHEMENVLWPSKQSRGGEGVAAAGAPTRLAEARDMRKKFVTDKLLPKNPCLKKTISTRKNSSGYPGTL